MEQGERETENMNKEVAHMVESEISQDLRLANWRPETQRGRRAEGRSPISKTVKQRARILLYSGFCSTQTFNRLDEGTHTSKGNLLYSV